MGEIISRSWKLRYVLALVFFFTIASAAQNTDPTTTPTPNPTPYWDEPVTDLDIFNEEIDRETFLFSDSKTFYKENLFELFEDFLLSAQQIGLPTRFIEDTLANNIPKIKFTKIDPQTQIKSHRNSATGTITFDNEILDPSTGKVKKVTSNIFHTGEIYHEMLHAYIDLIKRSPHAHELHKEIFSGLADLYAPHPSSYHYEIQNEGYATTIEEIVIEYVTLRKFFISTGPLGKDVMISDPKRGKSRWEALFDRERGRGYYLVKKGLLPIPSSYVHVYVDQQIRLSDVEIIKNQILDGKFQGDFINDICYDYEPAGIVAKGK